MCKLAEEKGERKELARKAVQEDKEAKRQAEAMAKQKAQASLTDCATPQKRPQTPGGSAANKAKVQPPPPPPRRAFRPKALPCPSSFSKAGVQQVPQERHRLPCVLPA